VKDEIREIGIKGKVTIQLFEQGKVVKKVEKCNFIGIPGKRWLMSCALTQLANFIQSNTATKKVNISSNNMFERLVLTDNTETVLPTALEIPGNLVGYADDTVYAGEDETRGTININDSGLDIDNMELSLVFDFATDKANGTFQTLGFKKDTSGYHVHVYETSGSSGYCCCINGTDIYFNRNSRLYKFNITTKTVTQLGTLQSGSPKGIAYYNNKIYYIFSYSAYDKVWAYDLATDTNSEIVQLPDDDSGCILFDGTNFYRTYNYSTTYRLYKYDTDWNYLSYSYLPSSSWTSYVNIVNSGWIMRSNGEELDMSDLETTRQNVTLNGTGQVVKYGSDYYKSQFSIMYPSIYESNVDSGLASGNNCGSRYAFGIDKGAQTLGTCIVLDNPVTKNASQTMKITYTFNITL